MMKTVSEDTRKRWNEGMAGLSRVLPAVSDDFAGKNLALSVQMLSSEASTALEMPNPRTIKGLAFALNDLIGMTGDLSQEVLSQFQSPFEALREEVSRLQSEFSLPDATAGKLRALRTRLTERRAAREKQLYLPPGTPLPPLPHEPAAMQSDAVVLQREVAAAGFEAPALDRLAANPSTFEIRDVAELIDEINAILE